MKKNLNMISLTEQWKKHQPYAKIEKEKLVIVVGRDVAHPMEEKHLIDFIDILQVSKAGLLRVKNFELKPGQEPKVEIPLSELQPGTYKIQARCNLHWTWEDEITL